MPATRYLCACLLLLCLQLPQPPSYQIFIDGPIQAATLDPACAASALCGGTLTVQNQLITVPKNLVRGPLLWVRPWFLDKRKIVDLCKHRSWLQGRDCSRSVSRRTAYCCAGQLLSQG